jgi:hypothetical protein
MKTYTFSEASQNLGSLLERAARDGRVAIVGRDGSTFLMEPATPGGSPLDIPGVDLGLTVSEIVDVVRAGRASDRGIGGVRPD